MIHAEADPGPLALSADWLTWGTYADDLYAARFGASRDVAGARECTRRLAAFLPSCPAEDIPVPENALERGLADLWRRTAAGGRPAGRELVRDAVLEMTGSWVWEVGNLAVNRIPDPVDYVEMRRKTFGADLTMSLARLGPDGAGTLPRDIEETRVVQELQTAWYRATPRYTDTGLRAAYLGFQPGPAGLGTAAALAGVMSRGADTPLNRG